jgi:hypothetical protein
VNKLSIYQNVSVFCALFSVFTISPAISQTLIAGGPSAVGTPVMTPRETGYPTYPGYQAYPAYGTPGYAPSVNYGYANPYANPYYQHYPGYGVYPTYNPYAPTYLGRYNVGGVVTPVFGAPQLINGSYYGINIGGNPYTFWQAPSGFYYPWSSGFSYTDRPILTMSSDGNPLRTQPPIGTVLSDLDSYLNSAKADGKISNQNFEELQQKANKLRKREESMLARGEGVIDPDDEIELRKEVDNLSKEVASRVQK